MDEGPRPSIFGLWHAFEWQEKVQRIFTIAPGRAGTGVSRTPLHLLEGTITPAGLHFERHHNGVA